MLGMIDNRTDTKPAPVPETPYQSILVWTSPALDSGPTCGDGVRTVDDECGDMFCPVCGVAPHVSSTHPLSVHSTGLAMDVNPDECPRDVAEDFAVLYARRKVAKFRFIGWRREFGNKGQRRRNYRSLAKRFKRLAAMRRQGKGRE